jgi:cell division protein FtsW (lipid II flippase)
LFITIVIVLLDILVYRWWSGDNGGSFILSLGMLAAFFLARKKWGVPLFLTSLVLVGGFIWATQSQSVRFDLAWGGEEGQILYYDQAKNLRLARDLARSGGVMGQGIKLPVPSGVRGNIHNDLVAAYVAGFFGWGILALALVAYGLLYRGLWNGLGQLSPLLSRNQRDQQPNKSMRSGLGQFSPPLSDGIEPSPAGQAMRQLLMVISGTIVVTFAVQAMWVMSAAIQPMVPLTGLDLQPISGSVNSALSFVLVLLGSVAVAHTANKTLPQ